jgi:hypothetical protein
MTTGQEAPILLSLFIFSLSHSFTCVKDCHVLVVFLSPKIPALEIPVTQRVRPSNAENS